MAQKGWSWLLTHIIVEVAKALGGSFKLVTPVPETVREMTQLPRETQRNGDRQTHRLIWRSRRPCIIKTVTAVCVCTCELCRHIDHKHDYNTETANLVQTPSLEHTSQKTISQQGISNNTLTTQQ